MMSLPKIVERPALPYVAIAENVTIPFQRAIDRLIGEMAGWLGGKGLKRFGPMLLRYNVIDMPRLGMEFGFVPPDKVAGDGRVRSGVLPAGRYATVTYFGHYEALMEVTGLLIAWARDKGIVWDATTGADGDHFACRYELYPNGPMDEPDPQKWETQIYIKVRD